MHRLNRILVAGLLALIGVAGPVLAQDQPYRELDSPQSTEGGAVEVREFFSYGCPHCHDFEPRLSAWAESMGDRIDVVHTPVTFGRDSWALLARAYYAAEALDILGTTHTATFEAIHEQGRQFSDADDVAAFYAEIAEVSEQAVLDALASFEVDASARRAERMVSAYGVPGTPAVGVAGRYLIDVRAAGGQAGMLDVAEQLVAEESSR